MNARKKLILKKIRRNMQRTKEGEGRKKERKRNRKRPEQGQ